MPESSTAMGRVLEAIGASSLVPAGSRGVVMLSGGPDSTALLVGLADLLGAGSVVALHLNYGLRPDSGVDQKACEKTCERLEVDLIVERPGEREGNLHDWARRERYEAAEALRSERGLDWIAVGHTSTDLAETVLYRLASSPGTRAMAAMPARRGSLVRPLLELDRETVRAAAVETGLDFVDDPSNADPSFARSRIRSEVLPVLAELNPGAVSNISRTRDEIEEESDLATSIAAGLICQSGQSGNDSPCIPATDLAGAHPAVARHAIRILAEKAGSGMVPASIERTAEVLRLCGRPEGGSVDLGTGVVISVESGTVLARRLSERPAGPDPVQLDLPGEAEWGAWQFSAERAEGPVAPRGPDVATLDAAGLPSRVEVRVWSEGDRIRPLGMEGSKSVADLLAERGMARSARRVHPVVVAGDEVLWVPGHAVAERLRIGPATSEVVLMTADRSDSTAAP